MSLMNLIVAARSAIQGWRQRERAYNELMTLDDRSLADIGIHRSEIPAVVEGLHEINGRQPAGVSILAGRQNPQKTRFNDGVRWLPPV